MKENKIEILAPCGSAESVEPAIFCGANAIYLGIDKFSARASAQNFTRETLKETVEFCHQRNVQVHVAINTIIAQNEITDALEEIEYCCKISVDAIIIQDLGLYYLAKKACPTMIFHCSTQMSIHTPNGVALAKELGYNRVVLSREMSKKEIGEVIEKNPNFETEVFIHGALCMCVSGQCYFSAMLGGRSGNRGECAGTCRLPFKVATSNQIDEEQSINEINNKSEVAPYLDENVLSLKDLSGIRDIGELADMGVSSVKIEGRLKRPEYVAASVSSCFAAKNNEKEPIFLSNALQSVFSRSGFTNGYLENKLGSDMFGVRSKEDAMSATKEVLGQLRTLYRVEKGSVNIDIKFTINRNCPTIIEIIDCDNNKVTLEGEAPQIAQNRPLSIEKAKEQLAKTGGTPFTPKNIEIIVSDNGEAFSDMGLTVAMGQINKMRRDAIEKLLEIRTKSVAIPFDNSVIDSVKEDKKSLINKDFSYNLTDEKHFRGHFLSVDQVPTIAKLLEIVYVPVFSNIDKVKELIENEINIGIELPRGNFSIEEELIKKLLEFKEIGIKDVYATNFAHLKIIKDCNMIIHAGFALNIFNNYSAKAVKELGAKDFEWSVEMSLGQIDRANKVTNLEGGMVGYGRQPLMLVRNCPIKTKVGSCDKCDKKGAIVDRKSIAFPVRCYNSICSEVFNSVPTYMLDRLDECKSNNFMSLRFTVENSTQIIAIINSLLKNQPSKSDFTRGLYYRGV